MNHCAIQQKHAFAACEEMRSSVGGVPVSDRRDPLVCPKPRRCGLLNSTFNDPIRPLRWHLSYQADMSDSKAGTDLLDIILSKGDYGAEQSFTQVASSPPYFSGSPPSRVANPLIQDARFGDEKFTPISPLQQIAVPNSGFLASPSTSASARKGGAARSNFGNKPAVRVEGFDCLDRDRRNRSVPALA